MCGAAVSPDAESCRECGEILPRPERKVSRDGTKTPSFVEISAVTAGLISGWGVSYRLLMIFVDPVASNDWIFDLASPAGAAVSAVICWVLVKQRRHPLAHAVAVVLGVALLAVLLSSCLL